MAKGARFHSVSRPSIYMDVAGQIRRAILEGTMSSGERLPPERELARQFGVSRATVREALRHLQAQGLLAARGRTSPLETAGPAEAVARFREALMHAVRLQEVPLSDLVELRIAIEAAALARAATAQITASLEEARVTLAVTPRVDVRPHELHEADVAFHVALVAASGHRALLPGLVPVTDAPAPGHQQDLALPAAPFSPASRASASPSSRHPCHSPSRRAPRVPCLRAGRRCPPRLGKRRHLRRRARGGRARHGRRALLEHRDERGRCRCLRITRLGPPRSGKVNDTKSDPRAPHAPARAAPPTRDSRPPGCSCRSRPGRRPPACSV